jgi:hypothetical protein
MAVEGLLTVAVGGLAATAVDGLAVMTVAVAGLLTMTVDGLAVVTVRRHSAIGLLAASPLGNRRRADGVLGGGHGLCSYCHTTEVPQVAGCAVSSPTVLPRRSSGAQGTRPPMPAPAGIPPNP